MKLRHSPLRFIHGSHRHECEPLGSVVVLVRDDLGGANRADAIEKLKQIVLHGIE